MRLEWHIEMKISQRTEKAVGFLLGICGLVGLGAQLVTTPSGARMVALLILSLALLAIAAWFLGSAYWWRMRAERTLPAPAQLDSLFAEYRISQAEPHEIDWVAELEASAYMPGDAVPHRVLKEWYAANPNGFSIVRATSGERVGHIDILPVRPATMSQFVQGVIVERDIRGDSLFSPAERNDIRDLYVESIIVSPPNGSNGPALLRVLSEFIDLAARVANVDKVESVYAIAATKHGSRLLERLGFEQVGRAEARADRHTLYRCSFSHLARRVVDICGIRIRDRAAVQRVLSTADKPDAET
jgi:hypothetical protein